MRRHRWQKSFSSLAKIKVQFEERTYRADPAAEEAEASAPDAAEDPEAMMPEAWLAALPVREPKTVLKPVVVGTTEPALLVTLPTRGIVVTALWAEPAPEGSREPPTEAAAEAAEPVTEARAPVRMGIAAGTCEAETAAPAHCPAAHATACALSTSPQAWRVQSLMPYAQLLRVQKQLMSLEPHWSWLLAMVAMLLTHSCCVELALTIRNDAEARTASRIIVEMEWTYSAGSEAGLGRGSASNGGNDSEGLHVEGGGVKRMLS